MNPLLATLICACGIAGLFYLGRDKAVRTSKALWLPVILLWIIGSRPVSMWLGIGPSPADGPSVQLDGSPLDAGIYGALTVGAIGVLIYRRKRAGALLAANWPILIYFFYCLVSVAWSYHPDVSFKRWIKATGDLAMALVIVTEPNPRAALARLFSRVGFLLLPASVLLIKYYGNLGRGYTPDGAPTNTGVTTNKNSLGVILLIVSLGTLWRLITLLRAKGQPFRGRQMLALGTLLTFEIALFEMADSVTSTACFALGAAIIIATGTRTIRSKPARVHILCSSLVLAGGLTMLFGGASVATSALGRKSNLSGRTDIWAALMPTVPSSIVGSGFESYWISPNVQRFQRTLQTEGWWHPETLNEAHNGYIEVYLELGWAGVGLISLILISGYMSAIAAFRMNSSIGGLILAYIIAAAVYSITEAGFRMMDPIWVFLLLAIVSARGVTAGYFKSETAKIRALHSRTASRTAAGGKLIPASEAVYARNGLT